MSEPGATASQRPLNILLVTTEVAPYAKVGGLADVAGALPRALRAAGHDVRVVMPCYPMVEADSRARAAVVLDRLAVPPTAASPRQEVGSVLRGELPGGVPLYLLRHPWFFSSAESSPTIYPQPAAAYVFFSRAVFGLVRELGRGALSGEHSWLADVLHCNDYHTGFVPALLANNFHHSSRQVRQSAKAGVVDAAWEAGPLASLFTIHNLAYQGSSPRELLAQLELPDSLFATGDVEFFNQVNWMKAGLVFADVVNTVSPTYAREITTVEYGAGLDGVLRQLAEQERLYGILNGIDTEEYDPAHDERLAAPYSVDQLDGKRECRRALQREFGLEEQDAAPVLGLVSRLFAQKGVDLLCDTLEPLMRQGFQLVVLGQGDAGYEAQLRQAAEQYPAQVGLRLGYDEALGPRIYAGADAFLMPSRFEPCGLGQLMSLRYGTLPVVRRTGGLADTVVDDAPGADSTGFVFDAPTPEALLECLERLLVAYRQPKHWNAMVRRAMRADFSWKRSAARYVEIYRTALARAAASL